LYELLSFIVPGFLLIWVVNFYAESVFGVEFFNEISSIKLADSVLYLIAALISGILLHRFTFLFIEWKLFKPYKKLVYPSIYKLASKNPEIMPILPALKKNYKEMVPDRAFKTEEDEVDELFDWAYYYLEVNDQISQVKSFQSLYFFIRNILTLALLFFLIILPITICSAFFSSSFCVCHSLNFLVASVIVFLLLAEPARWLRTKMIVRLFRSYYTLIVHKKNNL